ncbi:DUF4058 family protein [Alkalinema pantanalense CENA528]|uniref:DUF4058 family protein n=1 Tax=Alkalinema pantanalense TaxID=1620705 RepID=UPI003D6DD5A8
MPSPLPGMNPFLEAPELWSEFHSRMIVAIADALDDDLSRDYRVAVEKRVYLDQGDETVLMGIPDVSVMDPPTVKTTTTAVLDTPITVEIPLEETVQERYLEIREVATGRVVTVIELLSPKNKRSKIGREAYLQKRRQIMMSQTHWVEIDLLRGGEAMPMTRAVESDYRILVSASEHRPKAQLYAFNLRQVIPEIAIPLNANGTVTLALQPLLHRVYDKARLELAIDYQQSFSPKLSDEDAAWILSLVNPH